MGHGYIGEIFNSIQGEGLYVGRRQVFVRFAGCPLRCRYCDTQEFRNFYPSACMVEMKPSSMKFRHMKNPLTHEEVLRHVKRLTTQGTHSVSLTGGEPLLARNFLVDVTRACKREDFLTYLETSGADSEAMAKVVRHINIAAIDIKLPEHRAVPSSSWSHLFKEELACIELALKAGVETFLKIVVLPSTQAKTIVQVCKHLTSLAQVPLVIQPVTPAREVRERPSMTHVYRLIQAATRAGVEEIAVIPQMHKLLRVP